MMIFNIISEASGHGTVFKLSSVEVNLEAMSDGRGQFVSRDWSSRGISSLHNGDLNMCGCQQECKLIVHALL